MGLQRQILLDGAVGHWQMDDASGDFADLIAGRTAVSHGSPSYQQPGVASRYAANLGTYAAVPHASALEPAAVSLEAWIYLPTGTHERGLVVKSSTGSLNDGYGLYLGTTGIVRFYINQYNGTGVGIEGSALATATWAHYVGTYSVAQGNVKLYKNGVLEATSAAYTTAISSSGASLFFGVDVSSSGALPQDAGSPAMRYDEIAVYPSALSADRVLAHYRAGLRHGVSY